MTIEEQGRRIAEFAHESIKENPNSKYEIGIGAIHILSQLAKKDPLNSSWFGEVTDELKKAIY